MCQRQGLGSGSFGWIRILTLLLIGYVLPLFTLISDGWRVEYVHNIFICERKEKSTSLVYSAEEALAETRS